MYMNIIYYSCLIRLYRTELACTYCEGQSEHMTQATRHVRQITCTTEMYISYTHLHFFPTVYTAWWLSVT